MSLERRQQNPGRREREARKRHRRAWVWKEGNMTIHAGHNYFMHSGADAAPLKLGREHYRRFVKRSLAVTDSRKRPLAKGVEESGKQHEEGQDLPGSEVNEPLYL